MKHLFLILFFIQFAQAGLFKISNRNYGSLANTSFQANLDTVFDQLETEVNANLPNSNATTYLKSISNSAVMSSVGNTTDQSTSFSYGMFGFGAGAGADLGGMSITDLTSNSSKSSQVSGFALQGNYLLGLNLTPFIKNSFFTERPLKIFMNYFSQSLKVSQVTGEISSFGLHAQWKFYPEKDLGYGSLKWSGANLTTGYRQAKTKLVLTESITESTTQTINVPIPTSAQLSFNGTAEVGANIDVKSIPVEVSTGVRLLYVLNLFLGLGGDYSWGTAESIASVSGPVSVNTSPSLGSVSGTATLDLGDKSGPNWTNYRYFYGLQFEMGVLAMGLQINQNFDKSATGGSFTVKAYY